MPTIEYEDRSLRIIVERNVGVLSFRDAPNVMQLRAHDRVGKQLQRTHKQGTMLVNLVHSGTPNFTQEVTKETARIVRQEQFYDLGAANVLLVGGLGGVAARAFLSTALLVSRSPRPTRVFSNLNEAIDWTIAMLQNGTVKWTREELFAICDQASKDQAPGR
ncbi:hypothetical protein BH09MYX1_BH09MYX1_54110 [soil metagenome]